MKFLIYPGSVLNIKKNLPPHSRTIPPRTWTPNEQAFVSQHWTKSTGQRPKTMEYVLGKKKLKIPAKVL